MKNNIVVSVCMITYNHEQYIAEAIEGVLMQKTDFPIELIIGEDCSTDKTREICIAYQQKYPEIIKLQLPDKNKGIMRNFIENMQAAQGKYIALCEGDDYWTDPRKLQKQVDFLDANEDFSMCCHRYKILYEETQKWEPDYGHSLFTNNIEGIEFDTEFNFMKCWLSKTMTVVFRRSCLNLSHLYQYTYCRDVHLFYHILSMGKGFCMNYDAAVYRINDTGVHGMKNSAERLDSSFDVFDELIFFNKTDKALYNVMTHLDIMLFTGFISSKFPFFHFNEFKGYAKLYSKRKKKSLFLYPAFFIYYLSKRVFMLAKKVTKGLITL